MALAATDTYKSRRDRIGSQYIAKGKG